MMHNSHSMKSKIGMGNSNVTTPSYTFFTTNQNHRGYNLARASPAAYKAANILHQSKHDLQHYSRQPASMKKTENYMNRVDGPSTSLDRKLPQVPFAKTQRGQGSFRASNEYRKKIQAEL